MATEQSTKLIVGLDIGTSKVTALVGEIGYDGQLAIIGVGASATTGVQKGMVVNVESTVHSIQRAVELAQQEAGCEIHSAFVGIGGNHIKGFKSNGMVAIDGEIRQSDVDQVLKVAKAVPLSADQRVLHTLPQDYVVDNREGIREPVGINAVRLETRVFMITCGSSAAQNIEKCVQRCNLQVDQLVMTQLASAYAVLINDEKEMGVCLVDIGAGTTDVCVFHKGVIRYTAVFPIAGYQITKDITNALRTPEQYAEDIKLRYACAMAKLVHPGETISVHSVGDRPPRELFRQSLAELVEPRYDELFTAVQTELRRSGMEDLLKGGIVLTGGGAKMEGVLELAEEIFQMPVRLGAPQTVKGLTDVVNNPIYSTGVGLLLYGMQDPNASSASADQDGGLAEGKGSVLQRLKRWVQGNF